MATTVLSDVPGGGGAVLYRVAMEVRWFPLVAWVITLAGVGAQNIPTSTTAEGRQQQDAGGMDDPIPGAVLGPGHSLLCATLPPPTDSSPGGAVGKHDFSHVSNEERNCSVGVAIASDFLDVKN